MKKLLTRLAVSGTTAAILTSLVATPSFAIVRAKNLKTGPYSNNTLKARDIQSLTHEIDLKGSVKNDLTQSATAGDLHSDGNTSGGNVSSGGAMADRTTKDFFGTVNLTYQQTASSGDVEAWNEMTGPHSNNTATAIHKSTINIDHDCNGKVENKGTITASTGNNSSNGNTLGGNVSSGDASATADLSSDVCTTVIDITQN